MAAWHSIPLEVAYEVLRWIAFFSCSFSFYPKVILNYSRKSVVGLNFDFLVLNLTNHPSYLSTSRRYFSPVIQKQNRKKYGFDEFDPGFHGGNQVHPSGLAVYLSSFSHAIMNFGRKSTEGWSIGKILLVLLGGLTNYAQLAVQSVDQGTLVNFYGNIGKTLLSLEVVFFALLLIIQHYVLFRPRDVKHLPEVDEETAIVATPLLKPNDAAHASNA